jgi:hypothetical protein
MATIGGKLGGWQAALLRFVYMWTISGWQPPIHKTYLINEWGMLWSWSTGYPYILALACDAGKPEVEVMATMKASWEELEAYLVAWRNPILRAFKTLEDREFIVRNQAKGGPIFGKHGLEMNERIKLTRQGRKRGRVEYESQLCPVNQTARCSCDACRGGKYFGVLSKLLPPETWEIALEYDEQTTREQRIDERQMLHKAFEQKQRDFNEGNKARLHSLGFRWDASGVLIES